MVYIVREGESTVGVHFVATHAPYCARGWIKSLEMIDGPLEFSLYFNETEVARTTNGIITRDNFAPAALRDLEEKTNPDDMFTNSFPRASEYWNMTFQGRVFIVATTPPPRQNYYVRQTWAQVFRERVAEEMAAEGVDYSGDMKLVETPCMLAFNLRQEDPVATILKTTPLTTVSTPSS